LSTKSRGFLYWLRHRPAGRLPISTYFGYGVGQVGGQILRDTPALILPIYMTTVLGMEAALAGLVIIIAKFWVVAADPVAGVISDRTETRWGRRRPFILGGGLLAAGCFILLFFVPAIEGQMVRTLVNETQRPGLYRVPWRGLDDGGLQTASGLYFGHISIGNYESNQKMLLLR